MQVKCSHFWSLAEDWKLSHLQAITGARSGSLPPQQTILHLTWLASLESTFQVFGKPFSHCPSQSWHFRQHDRKDVMSAALQVLVTVVTPALSSSVSSPSPILSHVTNNHASRVASFSFSNFVFVSNQTHRAQQSSIMQTDVTSYVNGSPYQAKDDSLMPVGELIQYCYVLGL